MEIAGRDGATTKGTLLGRSSERAILDQHLSDAQAGTGTALVIRGELGIGKSALVDDFIASAPGAVVARSTGSEPESELAYAALHQLLMPFLHLLPELPEPQRKSLNIAFGAASGETPDAFRLALASLSLLVRATGDAPLICVVDHAQWLDEPSLRVLTCVGRRLLTERILLLFCRRDRCGRGELLDSLDDMRLAGIPDRDAGALLNAAKGGIDPGVAERLVAESGGNPLALLRFARELSDAFLTGEQTIPFPLPLGRALEEYFSQEISSLPADFRMLLLMAAAEPGDTERLQRAAETVGISLQRLDRAQLAAFVTLGSRMEFHHPLTRCAVYHAADVGERRQAHEALAAAFDDDRRAWHRSATADWPDEQLAHDLDQSSRRALARGGHLAQSAHLARAGELTPDPERRTDRILAAAEAALSAADDLGACRLLARTEPRTPLARARGRRVEGGVLRLRGCYAEAVVALADAARCLDPLDPLLALEAWYAALEATALVPAGPTDAVRLEAAGAVLSAIARHAGRSPLSAFSEAVVDGLAALIASGYSDAAPMLHRAAVLFCQSDETSTREGNEAVNEADALRAALTRLALFGGFAALDLWDLDTARNLLDRVACLARRRGARDLLLSALIGLHALEVAVGRLDYAEVLLSEVKDATRQVGGLEVGDAIDAKSRALQGRDLSAREASAALVRLADAGDIGWTMTMARSAMTVLAVARGQYREALASARTLRTETHVGFTGHVLPDLVEAAVRVGETDTADDALEDLEKVVTSCPTPLGQGLLARSQALRAPATAAEAHFIEALNHLGQGLTPFEHARTRLVYGEWLRRQRRRTEAAEHLFAAQEQLIALGAHAFAERALTELCATGARPGGQLLTAQESEVAALAGQGLTNREIGEAIFISESTVAYHLRKVYKKLDISSRRQLADHQFRC